jgi:TRAP-type C4-dicarboxylate transport system permease small subunit
MKDHSELNMRQKQTEPADSKITAGISIILFYISAVGIVAVLLIVFCNVIARYVFNSPFHWAEELTSIGLIILGFFPAAHIWRKGVHIKFDLLAQKLVTRFPRGWIIVESFISLCGIIFSVVLVWKTAENTYISYAHNMREPSMLGTPLWILFFCVLLGSAALMLVFINSIRLNFERWRRGS